jgi:GH35 family endo-1,4-beta-xylanase
VKFKVFKNGVLVKDFGLYGAYMFGTDGIAIRRAEITFKDGVLDCNKPNLETAGLSLLWPVEGFGKVMLPTTCLPDREEPYNLNLEIARGKLMCVVNKREDWSFFNTLDELEGISKEARELFVRAIQNISNFPECSKFADEALKKGMVVSEKLSLKHAGRMFENRGKGRGFSRGSLGCCVEPARMSDSAYIERVKELFGFITVPVNWGMIERSRGVYDFSSVDACMAAFSKKRLALCTGPLLRFSKDYLPKWLVNSGAGFEKIREAAYRFVARIVSRYWGTIHVWRVISGLNVFNHFGFNFEQILEMTRAANMAVKRGGERAVKIVEVFNPWGEYYSKLPNTIPPLVYVDMVVQSGIHFDAFGLQIHFGKNQPGMHVRDMMQISSVMDYFGSVGKPLYLTGIEVPSQPGQGPDNGESAGIWHDQWDQWRQGEWIEQFYKIALSKPFVENVTWSNLADSKNSVIPGSGLMTAELEAKESFRALKKLQEVMYNKKAST